MRVLLLLFSALALVGCSQKVQYTIPELSHVEDYEVAPDDRSVQNGSLWSDTNVTSIYFLDQKARRINDIITVRVVESSSASNSGNVATSRDSSVNMGVTSVLGKERGSLNPAVQANAGNSFSGSGQLQKADNITATVSTRIVKVLNNGNMVLRGKREIMIDNEKQMLFVSGVIRPEDIDADNTVMSSALADAQIMYTGSGALAASRKPGWGTTFLNTIWPF
ncbi:flagellar basal body L-ring protein FlgH [Desulfurispirillum indicum]|uniref:flagellar basal body L-ring protein FlgH n=1 Tax=Desulfurispirillum indicum TaxID=936456 RepID=UPI001CF95798|nr:flagellar basal body L-ring protein FlgH [Desulfurispirillum indicum]UCZ57851.1 flagellar basal body L-ring protein FlgH [Desulfurispirillum indicum]